jgi:hypothetical protein
VNPNLHVIGVDPGGTTGWALLTIPRDTIYGNEPGQVLEWDYGEFYGNENLQVRDLCRLIRGVQNLDYLIGPAVVVEDFDIPAQAPTTDASVLLSPVRIAAKLEFAAEAGLCGDARIVMQGRAIAKSTMTDERLKKRGYWLEGEGDHIRDAIRHAFTALRRAKANPEFRDEMWYKGTGPRKERLITRTAGAI